MSARLIFYVILLSTAQVAFGQCGSAHETDLDGSYVSSTSSDQCSSSATDQFMESSYHKSYQLSGYDKLVYLVQFCRASVGLSGSSQGTREAAFTLFHLAAAEKTKARAVGQKNAATCLSYVDPAGAMYLLSQVKFQPPVQGEWLYEDPRYNAAETIFANFAKAQPLQLSSIVEKARYLGQTGQYPYVAIAKLIRNLPISFRSQANLLLQDAISFYSDERGFYNRDEEFLHLLRLLKESSVDKKLAASAAAIFVERLNENPIHLPGDYYSEIHMPTSGKVISFVDRNRAFLFQAFPHIKRLNPALAEQLRRQDPTLNWASDNMTYVSGGFVQGNPTPEEVTHQHLRWLQEDLLERIQEYRESDPPTAVALVHRLTNVNSSVFGVPGTITSMADQDLLGRGRSF